MRDLNARIPICENYKDLMSKSLANHFDKLKIEDDTPKSLCSR